MAVTFVLITDRCSFCNRYDLGSPRASTTTGIERNLSFWIQTEVHFVTEAAFITSQAVTPPAPLEGSL